VTKPKKVTKLSDDADIFDDDEPGGVSDHEPENTVKRLRVAVRVVWEDCPEDLKARCVVHCTVACVPIA
jgi:hypothetical protein